MPRKAKVPVATTSSLQTPSTQKFAVRMGDRPTLADRLLGVIAHIPPSRERPSDAPQERAQQLAQRAAAKSAATAGVLALPPGAFGWATITPELYAVWKIQAQMVSDIAGVYGKTEHLGREQMLYCLFGHTAAGVFKDLVVQVGERYLVRRTPLAGLYAVGNKIALLIAQRSAGRLVTRWVPALGALGVAGFVYVDTGKVADTAIGMFSSEIEIEDAEVVEVVAAAKRIRATPKRATAAGSEKARTSTTARASRARKTKAASPAE